MEERIITAVRIRHHRIEGMPHFVRLTSSNGKTVEHKPIDAPRGILTAMALSGAIWLTIIALLNA